MVSRVEPVKRYVAVGWDWGPALEIMVRRHKCAPRETVRFMVQLVGTRRKGEEKKDGGKYAACSAGGRGSGHVALAHYVRLLAAIIYLDSQTGKVEKTNIVYDNFSDFNFFLTKISSLVKNKNKTYCLDDVFDKFFYTDNNAAAL